MHEAFYFPLHNFFYLIRIYLKDFIRVFSIIIPEILIDFLN